MARHQTPSRTQPVDLTVWYEEHDARLYHLLHMLAKALARASVDLDDELSDLVAGAYGDVRSHAKQLVGNSIPIVLAKDRKHTIDYDELAEARAKIRILTFELNELRGKTCISNRYTNCPSTTLCISDRYTDGRRAMHAEVVGLFERPIAQFKAATEQYPNLAGELDKAVHPLHVMLAKVREVPVETPKTGIKNV
ncbi:hypothetical protein G7047_14735 [Diaphorobacter sp. HDW4A]|uniref:hypothetical protein n=1 Tax=Diaphorobacter sp. HDW4A TaxID=2714924 RepID=UPI00140BCB0C|nr:hypothetical protein [Diaphorobacter sp. HDW4A]QIL81012.1 hypothetical protein G7047_14735 [Diaphorobacter sp. HDW4A]